MDAMNTDTRELLAELRQDHRNMARVLDLMDDIVTEMEAGKDPDFELFDEAMRYMTVYPDAVHHPKEDVLYSAMRAEKPDLAEGLDRVGPEHRDIAEAGEALRNDVEAVASGAAVTREHLVEDASNYVRTLRKHMAWEEEDLFRRARDLIRDEKDMFIDISNFDQLDPVFGPEREHSFENLLRNIKNLSAS